MNGLLSGTARALSRVGRQQGLIGDDGGDLRPWEVKRGLTVILNVQLDAFEHGNSVTITVGNRELFPQVEWMAERQLGAYLAANPGQAYKVVHHCLEHRRGKENLRMPVAAP